jgi:hypothetical protein
MTEKEQNIDRIESLSSILPVVEYLAAKGWKIKKSSAYKHVQQGKIRPGKDGLFYIKDVEKYARTFLKRIETGQKMSVTLETMQKKRLKAETEKLEAQAKHWTVKAKVSEGSFVDRHAFELALAQRAAVFKNDIESFIRGNAEKIIILAGGNANKTPDVIEYMMDKAAEWLNRYADEREFAVPTISSDHKKADLEKQDEAEIDDDADADE